MPKVTFITSDGESTPIDVPVGNSLMIAAVFADLDGIEAVCGGRLSCATCHVYVDPGSVALLPPPGEEELRMLEIVAAERRSTSRLSCQIEMSEAMAGLVVRLPEAQS
jgi:2Fe-2S ferredoxin